MVNYNCEKCNKNLVFINKIFLIQMIKYFIFKFRPYSDDKLTLFFNSDHIQMIN